MSRILLVVRRLWRGGGTETYVFTLARELQRSGHTVGVFSSGGQWVSYFQQHGIRVHISNGDKSSPQIRQVVHDFNYRVVHAQDSWSFSQMPQFQDKHHIRVIYTVHGRYTTPQVLKRYSPFAHAIIAVSPSLQYYVQKCGIPARKIHLIQNGIDLTVFHPASPMNDEGRRQRLNFRTRYGIPEGAFVIGYAGRFTFDKVGLSKRIALVLAHFAKTYSNTYVIVAGRNSAKSMISTINCKVIGHVSNMNDFYHACDVVVGTARVAMESLVSAVPTIAVGYAKYIGIIDSNTVSPASQSNFGDHGTTRLPWSNRDLLNDIQLIRSHLGLYRTKAVYVSRIVRERYSSRQMVKRILKLYGL